MIKVGIGYDIHPLVKGRPLILGGVAVPYDKGLKGHSDADVLIHAVCNALLGALGKGDLGSYYPNSDPRYRNYPSTRFLEEIAVVVTREGFHIVNVDSVVIAQEPRLSAFMDEMKGQLAKMLGMKSNQVGVKAATPEGIGSLGRGEGIAAQAICLIERPDHA
jgi:2-C-methyl-D-erythritol 2,4-cyclodiphosphate synthase